MSDATGTIISVGIDPGLASTGIGAIERFPDGSYRCRGVRVSRTQPNKDKAFTKMRTSADDQRRIRDHFNQIYGAIQLLKPHVIGIEAYTIFEPNDIARMRESAERVFQALAPGNSQILPAAMRPLLDNPAVLDALAPQLIAFQMALAQNTHDHMGLGQAAKTIAVYGAALAAAFTAGVPVFVFQPYDLKKRFGGRKGASKEEVGAGLELIVHGLKENMASKVPQKTLKEHAWDGTGHAILAADEYMQLRLDAPISMGMVAP